MAERRRAADGHGAVVAFLENRGGDSGATLAGRETLTSRAQVFDGEAQPDHSNGHAALTQRHGPPEPTTPYAFAEIAFTPSVKAAQQRDGSRAGYARNFERDAEVSNDRLMAHWGSQSTSPAHTTSEAVSRAAAAAESAAETSNLGHTA